MRVFILGLLLCLLAACGVVAPGAALTMHLPRTLSDRRPVSSQPERTGFRIGYLGVTWKDGGGSADAHLSEAEVRFLRGDTWGPWVPLVGEGAKAEGQWASTLVPAQGAQGYQVRGLPPTAKDPEAVTINTSDGPATGRTPSRSLFTHARCLSRADWGADESMRFDEQGRVIWPVSFHPLQVVTIHHSENENGDDEWPERVRAMYHYHAVELGWGDLGYNALIDELGRVYEGRWSGKVSRSCLWNGGDGSDFGHAPDGRVVTGGHNDAVNEGNFGISVLGDFHVAAPTSAAVDGLEESLARLLKQHHLNPVGTVNYRNPVDGVTRTLPTISAHIDWVETYCPGEYLLELLPAIRQEVMLRMTER